MSWNVSTLKHAGVLDCLYDMHDDWDVVSFQEWTVPGKVSEDWIDHRGKSHVVITAKPDSPVLPKVSKQLRDILKRIQSISGRKQCSILVNNRWADASIVEECSSALLVVTSLE